ncbi:MAG: hypothetical protein E6Q75_06030 [Rheinheimera sp.]|nr:MAG: hypothetical protein E6Q75_06030 [Rheinheimera sp.]
MTKKVTEICENLEKLSHEKLHLVYIRTLNTGLIPKLPIEIPYNCNADKISHLKFHMSQDSLQAKALFDYVESIMKIFHEPIPEQNFEWIDPKNQRQCIYLWLFIQTIPTLGILQKTDKWGRVINAYPDLSMPSSPSCAKTCLELAKDFFNLWNMDQPTRIEAIEQAKLGWIKASKFKHKMIKNLEKGIPELTSWFENYSAKYSLPNLSNIEMATFAEKLPLVLAKIDMWNITDSEKIVILNKAYNAMASQKFKQKPDDQKGANFWLGATHIRMISHIAKKKKMSERDILLSLINDAYIKTEM